MFWFRENTHSPLYHRFLQTTLAAIWFHVEWSSLLHLLDAFYFPCSCLGHFSLLILRSPSLYSSFHLSFPLTFHIHCCSVPFTVDTSLFPLPIKFMFFSHIPYAYSFVPEHNSNLHVLYLSFLFLSCLFVLCFWLFFTCDFILHLLVMFIQQISFRFQFRIIPLLQRRF